MLKNYKFSIVIAIYNMELYLEEAVQSLLCQTIGFEENLQVLFVNDGSSDQSEEICLDYVRKYPDNIQYIKKENGGVSSARNAGLPYVKGELVNFLDADDKLAEDALEKVYAFYMQFKDEVDLISIPLHFFEAEEGEHLLNFKFESTRVVDIQKEPKCFQMHISSSFIKASVMENYSFDTNLKFGEDALVANKIILDKGKYGVISDTMYLYRKRNTGSSVIQGARVNKNNYIPPLKYLHLKLLEFAIEKYQEIPEYLQRMLVYDLGWKLRVPTIEEMVLSSEEIEEFFQYAKKILAQIDDSIILSGFNTQRAYNLYMLQLKKHNMPFEELKIVSNKEDAILLYEENIVDMLYKQVLNIGKLEVVQNVLKLEGSFRSVFLMFGMRLYLEVNGKQKELLLHLDDKYQVTSLNQKVFEGYHFSEEIRLDGSETKIRIIAKVKTADTQIKITFRETDGDSSDTALEKAVTENYQIVYRDKAIVIQSTSDSSDEKMEMKSQPKKRNLTTSLKKILSKCRKKGKQFFIRVKRKDVRGYVYASTYNQVCMHQGEELVAGKLTDSLIIIEQYQLNDDVLKLTGRVQSNFLAEDYSIKCLCNLKRMKCEYNQEQQIFQVNVSLVANNQITFSMMLGNAESTIPIKLNDKKMKEAVHSTRYQWRLKEKQTLEVYS